MFDYAKNYILEDDFVQLSPLNASHSEALFSLAEEEALWTYFLENGRGRKAWSNYFLRALDQRRQQKEYPYVVYDKIQKQYAGMTRIYELLPNLRSIKMGHTWYGKNFWGTGLNKHCKYLLFEWIFEQLGMVRIGFGVHGEKRRSIAALHSVGCQQEGVLRDFLPALNREGRTDLILLSILQSEWLKDKKTQLCSKLKNKTT